MPSPRGSVWAFSRGVTWHKEKNQKMKPNLNQAIFLASSLFIIEFAIKFVAFDNSSVLYRIGPSICFWATGLFFSLTLFEQFRFKGQTKSSLKKKSSGYGIEIDYSIILPESLETTPKYMFLFVIQLCLWILNLIMSQKLLKVTNIPDFPDSYFYSLLFVLIVVTGYSIGAIISVLKNEFV